MQAYKTYLTIKDPKHVILPNTPFSTGQYVEVVLLSTDDNRKNHIGELQTLFKTTQGLPQLKTISEESIIKEIETYRRG